MNGPYARAPDPRAVDGRVPDGGVPTRGRRQGTACSRRFTTLETTSLNVIKQSGAAEPFSRTKVINGVRKACQGRPVTDHDLAVLAQEVEETVRMSGAAEIPAHQIGLAILEPLQRLDEVAYLRFASVYQDFTSLSDFESAIAKLREERSDLPRGNQRPLTAE